MIGSLEDVVTRALARYEKMNTASRLVGKSLSAPGDERALAAAHAALDGLPSLPDQADSAPVYHLKKQITALMDRQERLACLCLDEGDVSGLREGEVFEMERELDTLHSKLRKLQAGDQWLTTPTSY